MLSTFTITGTEIQCGKQQNNNAFHTDINLMIFSSISSHISSIDQIIHFILEDLSNSI